MKSTDQEIGAGNAGLFVFVVTALWLLLFYSDIFR